MKEKLNRTIIPYLIISSTYFILFSIMYWLQNKYLEIDESYFGYWLPIIISTILVWFVIRKKLKNLVIEEKHYSITLFIVFILLTLPVITFTYYLNRESGKITYLNQPSDFFRKPQTMYYSIESTKIDKANYRFSVSQSTIDRGNEIAVGCYYIAPLLDKDKPSTSTKLWIGLLIGEKFSNRVLDDKNKQEKQISNFIDSSNSQFNKHQFQTKFLKKIAIAEEDNYKKALDNTDINPNNIIILREEQGTYETRTGSSLIWTLLLFTISNIAWFLLNGFQKSKNKPKSIV
ncbi:hypothetical protein [Chryseobacterium artocarpi]|nr:hypothetical protein [Chryseobacterium artocarpi]